MTRAAGEGPRDAGIDGKRESACEADTESVRMAALMQGGRGREAQPELTLLVRAYCHLCDEMRAELAPLADAAGARITEIDVDADPAVEARFGDLVPVLLLGSLDGVELCHYRLDRPRVAQALRDSGPGPRPP
jgi:hypothetical protein